jgi:hypothetical protein
MKKTLHTLLIIFLLFTCVSARQVNTFEIKSVANNFLETQSKLRKIPQLEIVEIHPLKVFPSEKAIANIIKLNPKGFLVVSNDINYPPIIAYSFNHNWNDDTSSNNLLYHLLIRDMDWRSKSLSKLSLKSIEEVNYQWETQLSKENIESVINSFKQWPEIGATHTGGWVETTWHQRSPYNDFCPIDPDTNIRSAVGCVATAMAQIVNYHKYIGDLQFNPDDRYTAFYSMQVNVDDDSIRLDFPSFSKLNDYLASLKYKYQNNIMLMDSDLAALNFACGISVCMGYHYDGSGASANITRALKEKMSYFNAEYRTPDSYFYNELKENMMNGLPALLAILQSETSIGHAIVVDGYNTEGYYHLNYGSGSSWPTNIVDAWYLIPSNMGIGYDVVNCATMHIKPYEDEPLHLDLSTKNIVFNGCHIGEKSNIQNCTVTNISNDPIQIDYIVTTENFLLGIRPDSLTDSLCSVILNGGDSLSLFVQCIPSSFSLFQGSLIISYSNPIKYLNVGLVGYGVPREGTIINSNLVFGTWSKNESPYYICGDIAIAKDEKLTIKPGIEIVFLGQHKIEIGSDAQLIAKGTKEDSIYFTSREKYGWYGIKFTSSSNDDTLSYCVIKNVESPKHKPVIGFYHSSPVLSHTSIHDNKAGRGVILFNASASIINKSKVERNLSLSGSVIQIQGTFRTEYERIKRLRGKSPLIMNTLICQNTSGSWGAVSFDDTSPTFVNVTISHNETLGPFAGTIILGRSTNHVKFTNSILMANKTKYGKILVSAHSNKDTLSFEYSNVDTNDVMWSRTIAQISKLIWGSGNICQDPRFINPEGGKFTLDQNSPCIDSGNPDPVYYDIYDPYNPGYALWPAKGTYHNDMGAYGGGRQDILNEDNLIPDDFNLLQNFPNPFNSSTTIEFYVHKRQLVTINIYDILGQKVKNIFNRKVDPGKYKLIWNGENDRGLRVSSGIYFYFLVTNRFYKAKKMIVLN